MFSDRVDTARGWVLEQLEELLQMIPISIKFILYQRIGSFRIDDKIIYYWYFNFVECFDSTSSDAIDTLIKNLESLLSLDIQHMELSPLNLC